MRFGRNRRRGPLTRLGIVLVIICCLAGNGCSHSDKPEEDKTASIISSDSVTVAEEHTSISARNK